MSTKETSVIVVGAGPAGLAAAACLRLRSIPYLLLEREDCFASLWRKYAYDRLHLHLPKRFSELPHFPIPVSYPTYLSKSLFLHHLEQYVAGFDITPIYGRLVEKATYDPASRRWKVEARRGGEVVEVFSGRFLVVATGENADPFIPHIPGLDTFPGRVMHSTSFKSGKDFQHQNVLVVGSGNSGMDIVLDLALHAARTSIVVRSPVHILSREMVHLALFLVEYIPISAVDWMMVMLSKLVYGDLTRHGIRRPQEGPFSMKLKYGKYPLIDVGAIRKIKSHQINVLPSIARIIGNEVTFENGKAHVFDSIVFATGFKRSTRMWLMGDDYLLNEDGIPRQSFPHHWKAINGLYCVGLSRTGLYGIKSDAQKVADDIKTLL